MHGKKKYFFKKCHKKNFKWDYRYLHFVRIFIILFNSLLIYLIIKGMGIKALGIFIGFHLIKELAHYIYFLHFENKILNPIDELKRAVEQVAEGNYDVNIDYKKESEIGLLISSFNEMAQKLKESEEMKAEYEENRKALIANISHDLKTPITSIKGYLEAIREGAVKSPDKIESYLEIAYKNTKYINRLMDDLFLFSKLDMQKVDFNFKITNIKAFMEDLMQEFIFELEEKEIEVNFKNQIEKECYSVVDGKRIYQAIKNIIDNAEKHGPNNNLVIDILLKRVKDYIYLDIKDNGSGISEEKLPYIFDRFYRGDSERTKDSASTGLGLAIAKEIIEAHHGKVQATNTEEKGACFIIILPVKDSREEVNSIETDINN